MAINTLLLVNYSLLLLHTNMYIYISSVYFIVTPPNIFSTPSQSSLKQLRPTTHLVAFIFDVSHSDNYAQTPNNVITNSEISATSVTLSSSWPSCPDPQLMSAESQVASTGLVSEKREYEHLFGALLQDGLLSAFDFVRNLFAHNSHSDLKRLLIERFPIAVWVTDRHRNFVWSMTAGALDK